MRGIWKGYLLTPDEAAAIGGGYHSQPTYLPEVPRMTENELVDEFLRYSVAER